VEEFSTNWLAQIPLLLAFQEPRISLLRPRENSLQLKEMIVNMLNGNYELISPNCLTRETLKVLWNEGGIPAPIILVLNNTGCLGLEIQEN